MTGHAKNRTASSLGEVYSCLLQPPPIHQGNHGADNRKRTSIVRMYQETVIKPSPPSSGNDYLWRLQGSH